MPFPHHFALHLAYVRWTALTPATYCSRDSPVGLVYALVHIILRSTSLTSVGRRSSHRPVAATLLRWPKVYPKNRCFVEFFHSRTVGGIDSSSIFILCYRPSSHLLQLRVPHTEQPKQPQFQQRDHNKYPHNQPKFQLQSSDIRTEQFACADDRRQPHTDPPRRIRPSERRVHVLSQPPNRDEEPINVVKRYEQ